MVRGIRCRLSQITLATCWNSYEVKLMVLDSVGCGLAVGCARTEGYYKISYQEKSTYLVYTRGVGDTTTAGEQGTELDPGRETKKKVHLSREARSESRRWLSILSSQGEDYGDLLKFNQLKVMTLLLLQPFAVALV